MTIVINPNVVIQYVCRHSTLNPVYNNRSHLKGKLLALPTNNRLGWKWLKVTYGQAQVSRVLISAVKSFIVEVTMKDFEWKKKFSQKFYRMVFSKEIKKKVRLRFFFQKVALSGKPNCACTVVCFASIGVKLSWVPNPLIKRQWPNEVS